MRNGTVGHLYKKQTFCDEGVNKVLMAELSNTGCLLLSLAFVFPISLFICK